MRTIIRTNSWLVAAAAVAVLAGVSACGGDSATPPAAGGSSSAPAGSSSAATASSSATPGSGSASGTSSVPAELLGSTFVATEVTGTYTIAPGSSITLTFEDGTVGARAGCNSMSGAVTVAGDVITAPQLASTMMACEEALMAQDTWFAAFLASGPTYTYANGVLTLTNGTDTIAFTDAPSGAQALEATGWQLVGLISTTATANSVTAVDPTLNSWIRFKEGVVAFNTSCNLGDGPAEIGADTITFGDLRTTLIFCDGASGSTEQAVTAVLQGATSYTVADQVSGGTLTITSEDGTAGLQYVPDPTAGADAFPSSEGSGSATAGSTPASPTS